ncbi:MAG: DUF3592 domain-containing protein [Pseudomonadota bacterium]
MFFEIAPTGAIICTLIGLVFTALGWALWDEIRAYRRRGTLREAIVSDVRVRQSRKQNSHTYQPVFSFTDDTGAEVERLSLISSTAYDFAIGSSHRVLTLPDRKKVLLADGVGGRALSWIFIAMGLVTLLVGLQAIAGYLGA